MLILLYYVPAHNKVMHSGEGLTAFWGLFALWWLSRARRGDRTSAP
jgi:heme A synthase